MATDNEVTWKPDFTKPDPYADMPPEYEEKVKATFVPTAEHPVSPIEEARERGEVVGGVAKPPPLPPEPVPEAPPPPEPEVAPPPPEVAPPPKPTGWKPDFTKDDPWEGMPQEYVELEAATYKPTEEHPLPPSQETPEGIAAREKAPEVSREIVAIELAPESTPDKPVLSPEDYARFEKLQDEQQFIKSVELGLIPEGSKFAPIRPGEWGYYTPEQVAEIERAEAEAKELYERRVKIREIVGAREARELAEFEVAHTKLPDGQWINNEQLASLRTTAPDVYKALTTAGFATADKIVQEKQRILDTLKDYRVGITYEWDGQRMPEMGYDVKKYIASYPETGEATLLTAGFTQASIDTALGRIKPIPRLPEETFREQYVRLYDKEPPTIGAYEEEEVSLVDKFVSFFTGRGTGKLARDSEFLKVSIPGFIGGMSGAEYQTQVETEALYRYLFKEQTGRYPTYAEYPDIKAGLPRGIQVASVVPGVVTAYRWDTMSADQKQKAIQSDIAAAALYGMLAIGLTLKPGKVPIVKYKIVNEMGVPTGKTIKVPVYAPDTLGTKFATRNPVLWQRGATPLKIYGETGIKPITPILYRELMLRKPVLPSAFKGGIRTPTQYIPPTHIPSSTYFPGASYITARGVKINIPAGTITTEGLIPSGMEIWSRKGIDQPWAPFAHTGARILATPITGELTIIDVATGRTVRVGLPSKGAEVAIGAAPRPPSTLTMTPEQLAKLQPLVAPTPFIEYEITPAGLVAPRIVPYPTPEQIIAPGTSPMVSPVPEPSPVITPSPVTIPTPSVVPIPAPITAVVPEVTPTPAVEPVPALAVAPVPAPVVPLAPPPTPPPVPPPVIPLPLVLSWLEGLSEAEKKRILAEKGKVFWKERDRWLIIESPWTQNDVTVSLTPPPEATVLEGTPQETLKFTGKIPWKTMSIDYGDLDIVINVEGREIVEIVKTVGAIKIDSTGRGSLTDIGKRLPSTMKGISIPSTVGKEATVEELKEVPKEEEKVPFLTWVKSPGWMFEEDKPKVRKPSEPRYKTLAEKMAQGGRVVESGLRPKRRKKKPPPRAPGDRYYLGHKLPDSNLRVEL